MNNLLVPVDFSAPSVNAAFLSCRLAEKLHTGIDLIHVVEGAHEKIYQPFSLHEKYNNLLLEDGKYELEKLQRQLQRQFKNIPVTTVLFTGIIIERILKFAEEKKPGLIILGNAGAGLATRTLFGSTAASIINKCLLPVIAVPDRAKTEIPDGIIFATNHYERNKKVLDPLIELTRAFNALLHIVFFFDTDTDGIFKYADHSKYLEKYMAYLESNYPGLKVNTEILEGRKFSEAIEQFEIKYGADMLALVPYAKDFFEKLQSTTTKMAFHSTVPVLILPMTHGNKTNEKKLSNSKTML